MRDGTNSMGGEGSWRLSRRRLLQLTALGVAGAAGASSAAAARPSHVLTIEGTGSRATYEFAVTGKLEKSTANGANINGNDEISGSSASGVVGISADSYRFSGDLTGFELDGEANVSIDGEPLDPSQYLDHVLTIEGTGMRATYEFAVTGKLEKSTANGANVNGNDEIAGSSASGVVGISADSYAFSGALADIEVDGAANVSIDGEQFDPTSKSVLTIEGTGMRATYEFAVTGKLEKSTANGANVNTGDEIAGSSASGVVGISADSYSFFGTLTDIEVDGEANVSLNGERLDTTPTFDHTLTIASNGGRFSYRFAVSGDLAKSDANGATIDDNDDVSGRMATGQGGGGGRDSYSFAGELLDLDLDGDATVTLDGEEIDADPSPVLGIHNGLSDANFATIERMEGWQGAPYPVQVLFVPWNPDTGHMDWLFERVLPKIHDAGRVPLITWEPFTPNRRTKSVDTRALVERGQYASYRQQLAGTTPDDIEVRIANGEYDGYIDRWAERLREFLAGPDGQSGTGDDRRAYVRLAHEMNSDWYPWSPTVGNSAPASYTDMWRHVRGRFEDMGIGEETVQWMWCVNATDVGSYTAEELYPGDDAVDWLGIDGYQWGESRAWSDWRSPEAVFGGMLGRMRTLADKPVCIAETASSSATYSSYDPERKGGWIRDAFEYFDRENVEMWCWFNEDKETDWAMFGGTRGTETVSIDGEGVNAYAAYREAVDTHAASTNDPMTTATFTGER
ncbi:glycosyl hydrolase [Halococcus sp. AFM35]|uniref:glycoside hydrolase family 26 protein n=1 Tax=Halococcus sp. AFM35 TaxID=3421653 RepID=UPI003EBE89AB